MNIPFYQSEKNFRRFEEVIASAVESYPKPIKVNGTSTELQGSSVVTQLNNAIKYHRINKWRSLVINWSKFSDCFADLSARILNGDIIIGSKAAIKAAATTNYSADAVLRRQLVVEGPIDSLAVAAFATLLHFRLIDPVKITKTPIDCLPHANQYDVEIMKDGDGVIII